MIARRSARLFAFAGLLASLPAVAQPPAGQPAPPPDASGRTTIVVLEGKGLKDMLVDPKDAGVKRALSMIPDRLRELPKQLHAGNDGPPPQLFDIISSIWSRPFRFAVDYNVQNPASPYAVMLSLGGYEQADAKKLDTVIADLVATAPQGGPPIGPSKTSPGMTEMTTPVGALRWGPHQGDHGWSYDLLFGPDLDQKKIFKGFAGESIAGKNAEPILRGTIDFAPLAPLAAMLPMIPGGQQLAQNLQQSGVIGPNAMRIESVCALTADATVSHTIITNAKKLMAGRGAPTDALSAEELRIVPADAHWAQIARLGLGASLNQSFAQMRQMPGMADNLAQFQRVLGVDPFDMVSKIGNTGAMYVADSTGGSSIASLALVLSIDDPSFSTSLDTLVSNVNARLKSPRAANGMVSFREWSQGGMKFRSLEFPGLPIPVEPSFAIVGKWLVVGMTPQTVVAAAAQAAGHGDAGLASNPAYMAAVPKNIAVVSVKFNDVSKTLRSGYAWLSLGGSALANAVRSPDAIDRDPGLIIPPYNELIKGAKPSVGYSYFQGDDMIVDSTADHSLVVNAGAMLGELDTFMPVIGLAVAGFATAMQHEHGFAPAHIMAPPPAQHPNFMLVPADPAHAAPDAGAETAAPSSTGAVPGAAGR